MPCNSYGKELSNWLWSTCAHSCLLSFRTSVQLLPPRRRLWLSLADSNGKELSNWLWSTCAHSCLLSFWTRQSSKLLFFQTFVSLCVNLYSTQYDDVPSMFPSINRSHGQPSTHQLTFQQPLCQLLVPKGALSGKHLGKFRFVTVWISLYSWPKHSSNQSNSEATTTFWVWGKQEGQYMWPSLKRQALVFSVCKVQTTNKQLGGVSLG